MPIVQSAIQTRARIRAAHVAWCIRVAPMLAVFLLSADPTSRAAASCGDYVTVGATHSGSQANSYQGHAAGEAPGCRGWSCQRRLPTPAMPDNSLVGPELHEWAWHAPLTDADNQVVGAAPPGPTLIVSEGHLSRLLRPPIAVPWWR